MKAEKLFDVAARSIVITGGASGLGLGMARGLAENGAHVTLADIDRAALDASVSELGPHAAGELLDVTDREAVERVFDAIDQKRGGIDVVFVNAGISGGPGFRIPIGTVGENPGGTIDGAMPTEWDRVLAVNLSGARHTCAAAARTMKARGRAGRIIVTSSVAAIVNVPFVSTAYHASKAAVTHMARQLAVELAPHGILVNTIAPAGFMTNINGGAMYDEAVQSLFARNTLLRRTAEVREAVGLALFLASDASSFITGVQIPIDGGASLIGLA